MSTVRVTTDGNAGRRVVSWDVASVRYDPGLEQCELAGQDAAVRWPCGESDAHVIAARVLRELEVVAPFAFLPPDDEDGPCPCPDCCGPAPMHRAGQVRSDGLAPFESWVPCPRCNGSGVA